jgi:RecA-family ATPase
MKLAEIIEQNDPELQATKRRFQIRDAGFVLQPQEPITQIVESLITEGSVSLFYGEPGAKKTYSILSLAVCVALEKPWLGFAVQQRKVLFIDEESGERRLALRMGAAIRGEFGDEKTPIEFISLAGFKLDDEEDPKHLQRIIEEQGAGLVIIDALCDVMNGDENSKQDVQPVFTTLRKIAERTKAAIIVIHHSNKAGGYRGSSAIKGALDLMVKVESEEGSQWISFKTEKARDYEPVSFTAVANWSANQFYLSQAEPKNENNRKLPASQEYVLAYLKANDGEANLDDIEANADRCSPGAARQATFELTELGLIRRTNPGARGRGQVARYALVETGNDSEEDEDDS